MKVYFDTEFSDLIGIVCDIKLISAGFVAENGEEFYVEFKNNFQPRECSTFVHEAVLPHLNLKKYGMSNAEFGVKFIGWVQSLVEPVELCCDSIGYDWGLFVDLYSDENVSHNWPTNLSKKPLNVNKHEVLQGVENYFQYQPLAIRHHALWDARALSESVKAYECGIRYGNTLGSENDF